MHGYDFYCCEPAGLLPDVSLHCNWHAPLGTGATLQQLQPTRSAGAASYPALCTHGAVLS